MLTDEAIDGDETQQAEGPAKGKQRALQRSE